MADGRYVCVFCAETISSDDERVQIPTTSLWAHAACFRRERERAPKDEDR